ncbi:DUF1194 domain-containing protein [Rhodospirillales bacterium]|nr:DUF1194 domain-containing protein [Rhodospirillales bacterium]
MRITVGLIAFLMLCVVGASKPAVAQQTAVDLELVLAVDVSGSVDDEEAILQRRGYVDAFRDPMIIDAIKRGPHGAIAVTYLEWAGEPYQIPIVGWTRISNAEETAAFADKLATAPIAVHLWTSISSIITVGTQIIRQNQYRGTRRVIDVSGDGANNDGQYVNVARDYAVAQGITINGLPIINDRPSRYGTQQIADLDYYYTDCVIGGPGAFIIVANGFQDYARAVRQKLILEIAGLSPSRRDEARVLPAQLNARPSCFAGENRRQDYDDDY